MTFADGGKFAMQLSQPNHDKMTQIILVGLHWQWAHNVLGSWLYKNIIIFINNYSDERVLCSAPRTSSEKKNLRKIFGIGALRT